MGNSFKIFPLLLILTFSLGVKGQYNYKLGRIITNTNDTLLGLISDGGGIKNSKYCKFKPDKASEPKKYYPKDIKSYLFIDDKYYSSQLITIKNKPTSLFCDVLLEGKISLFYPRIGKNLPFYLKLESGRLVELVNEMIVYEKKVSGENPVRYATNLYIDTLYSIFYEAQIPPEQFTNLEYNDKSLQKITKLYLNSTDNEDNSIIYERNRSIYKPSYGVFTGIQYSMLAILNSELYYSVIPDNSISFPIGVSYSNPLNLLSDRLSFQMEFMLSKFSYNMYFTQVPKDSANQKMTSNVFSIPLFFKYGIKMKKFTPTLGFGKEIGFVFNSKLPYVKYDPSPDQESPYSITNYQIHWQQKGGWFFDLGLKYQIHPKYGIFTSVRFQKQRNLIIEDGHTKQYTYIKTKKENLGKEYATDMASLRIGVVF